jgi:hypothetical protein
VVSRLIRSSPGGPEAPRGEQAASATRSVQRILDDRPGIGSVYRILAIRAKLVAVADAVEPDGDEKRAATPKGDRP